MSLTPIIRELFTFTHAPSSSVRISVVTTLAPCSHVLKAATDTILAASGDAPEAPKVASSTVSRPMSESQTFCQYQRSHIMLPGNVITGRNYSNTRSF